MNAVALKRQLGIDRDSLIKRRDRAIRRDRERSSGDFIAFPYRDLEERTRRWLPPCDGLGLVLLLGDAIRDQDPLFLHG